MLGLQRTVPAKANLLAEREEWILDHPGWTYRDYDEAAIGDIAFAREYDKIKTECKRKALADEEAKRKAGKDE